MICLSDNDFIIALSSYDLIEEMLDVLSIDKTSVRVLPSAKYKLKSLLKKSPHSEGLQRAKNFLDSVEAISEIDQSNISSKYQNIDGIDPGEKLLLMAALQDSTALLATGDKRFLKALTSNPEYDADCSMLEQRVVCLEYVILRLCYRHGFDLVKQHVVPNLSIATSIKAAFGSGMKAEDANIERTLIAYITELAQETKNILLMRGI